MDSKNIPEAFITRTAKEYNIPRFYVRRMYSIYGYTSEEFYKRLKDY